MKLTNKRLYFDYNATSPINDSVKEFIEGRGFDFLNPSSLHKSGQISKKYINETKKFLYEYFSINEDEFNLFFHSGATEGINTLLLGKCKRLFLKNQQLTYYFSKTDHPAALEQLDFIKSLGHSCIEIAINEKGDFDLDQLVKLINKEGKEALMNFTYVNSLTGVVWDLKKACELKNKTDVSIHIDAVQSVAKIENYQTLESDLDCYTFSGHKFGALKGIGFSFVKKSYDFEPLLYGGGQEDGLRSGTQNTLGIYSLKLALDSVRKDFNFKKCFEAKMYIENSLIGDFGNKVVILGKDAENRCANTLSFILKEVDSKQILTAFDLAGIEISSGPACSSGSTKPVEALTALGFDDKMASSSLRFSFSPNYNIELAKNHYMAIRQVILNFTNWTI